MWTMKVRSLSKIEHVLLSNNKRWIVHEIDYFKRKIPKANLFLRNYYEKTRSVLFGPDEILELSLASNI
jgi:hypothetical protein